MSLSSSNYCYGANPCKGVMHVFDGIIFSAPNQGGGVFSCRNDAIICLDDRPTCGLSLAHGKLARAVQAEGAVVLTTAEGGQEYRGPWADIHDVLLTEQGFYLVSTETSEVLKWDIAKKTVVERWQFSEQHDSWHVNCLGIIHKELCFTAFGDFAGTRGYKNHSATRGFFRSIHGTKNPWLEGLSQPHSILTAQDGYLYLCDSETGNVRQYTMEFTLQRTLNIGGYSRGLAWRDGILFVGLSASRNTVAAEHQQAKIVAFDTKTWAEIDRIAVPCQEIYDLLAFDDRENFLFWVERILIDERTRALDRIRPLEEKLASKTNECAKLHVFLGY
ncbi:protein of unknown function [Acidithiobacillus ferrivorans]|uniref:Conserved hypothetical protein CHP03032 domain-containing protein n=2 Tax=Acidithiobacillus ferrivorans TaxID=160808 RepID=A0A060URT4_9PROT|nr:hypothetical protein AFERRI_530040 [Acidithiobacillus ferrivorans]SMH67506.1 protein of unknown function [Acidithiobacillus ferrivorans]